MLHWSRFEKQLLLGVIVGLAFTVQHLSTCYQEAVKESLAHLGSPGKVSRMPSSLNPTNVTPTNVAEFAPQEIPSGPLGEAIVWGEQIVTDTKRHAGPFVGNDLRCTHCHLQGGRRPWAAPWVGIWGVFPEYRSRSASVNTLEDRINDCFERSMNGKRLPQGRPEMAAILSYMRWLSSGVPTSQSLEGRGFKRLKREHEIDLVNGKNVYLSQCASCHGTNGEGQRQADGSVVFPPLWGERSFNIGAGMARLNTAAAFVKHNMPLGREGTLSDKDAFDVAAYFTRQSRPDFKSKHRDWPQGDKPEDARY